MTKCNVDDMRKALANQIFSHVEKTNAKQAQVIRECFESTKKVSIMQGPPGTGETYVNVIIAIIAGILGIPLIVTAPSNPVTKELVRTIFKEMKTLNIPADWFRITYIPTMVATKILLAKEDTVVDAAFLIQSDLDKFSADEFLDEYKLAAHIVRLASGLASKGDAEANAWLSHRERIKKGKKVAETQIEHDACCRTWLANTMSYSELLFQDPLLKIVISTCNNAGHDMI
jgi:hypothetical protein